MTITVTFTEFPPKAFAVFLPIMQTWKREKKEKGAWQRAAMKKYGDI